MSYKTLPCHAVSTGDCWTVTWQDPRGCCRGVGMPASCRAAAPCKGTPWYLASHPAKLSDQPWCECSIPPRSDYFRWIGGDWHMPWSCSCSPPGALHRTQIPKWGPGLCWGQEMNLQQVCWGWWSWRETAWFLAPQVPDVYFDGTDPDETPPFQSCVQPFFHLWAVSLAHITKSYIPWLVLRLCKPLLTGPPRSSSWQ